MIGSTLGRKAGDAGALFASQEEDVVTHSLASLCIAPSKQSKGFCLCSLSDQQGSSMIIGS